MNWPGRRRSSCEKSQDSCPKSWKLLISASPNKIINVIYRGELGSSQKKRTKLIRNGPNDRQFIYFVFTFLFGFSGRRRRSQMVKYGRETEPDQIECESKWSQLIETNKAVRQKRWKSIRFYMKLIGLLSWDWFVGDVIEANCWMDPCFCWLKEQMLSNVIDIHR